MRNSVHHSGAPVFFKKWLMEILQILVKCSDGSLYDVMSLPPEMRAELAQFIIKGDTSETEAETPQNGVIVPFGEPKR